MTSRDGWLNILLIPTTVGWETARTTAPSWPRSAVLLAGATAKAFVKN